MAKNELVVKDVNGTVVNVGDRIAFGASNGSTLYVGEITKLTAKRVFFKYKLYIDDNFECEGFRPHDRVAKIA